jgi:hypothetical protein
MALFSECSLKCARKVLDTADIVREAIFPPVVREIPNLTGGTVSFSSRFKPWCDPESRHC